MSAHQRSESELERLDRRIRDVEESITGRHNRIVYGVARIKRKTRETLTSPKTLAGAALLGFFISGGQRRTAGSSALMRTLKFGLLMYSRASLLRKLKALPLFKKHLTPPRQSGL